MSDLSVIANAFRSRTDSSFLLATLLHVQGSFYRRPGARALLDERGGALGSISAGCLERDLSRRGFWRTEATQVARLSYELSPDFDPGGDGSGCDGSVELLLERGDAPGARALEWVAEAIAARQAGCLVTLIGPAVARFPLGARSFVSATGQLSTLPEPADAEQIAGFVRKRQERRAAASADLLIDGHQLELFIEPVLAAPSLFICGAGNDALPLAQLGRQLGWTVTVAARSVGCSERVRFLGCAQLFSGELAELRATIDQCQRSAVVIMNHELARDRECLSEFLQCRDAYLGLLGPRVRSERLLAELGRSWQTLTQAEASRLHAPVGLSIGAETPAEVALSIAGEIQRHWARASGESLRDQAGPIHLARQTQRSSSGG